MSREDLTALLFALVVFVCCCGCTSERGAVVAVHKDSTYVSYAFLDSLVRSVATKDSVYVRDSVYVYKAGDTLTVERYQWRDRWRTSHDTLLWKIETHDTAYIERRDTLWRTVEVERRLTAWQKARMTIGDAALALSGIAVVACGIIFVRSRKR